MAVVGRIARAHGIRGQVIVNPETDFPDERFRPGAELFVRRGGGVEKLRIASARFQHERPVIAVDGIETMTDAEALAGCELRVPREQLMALPAGAFYRHDLIGCRVETATGAAVGVVEDVEEAGGGHRLVVAGADGEILVPLASHICVGMDVDAKRIVIDPPDGLLDLNVSHRGRRER